MRIEIVDGQEYRLPSQLNEFQTQMYVHLINWKWEHITRDRGRDRGVEYDAILPDSVASELRVLYPGVIATMLDHHSRFPFRIHRYFNHMASSQAANINLFLPILTHTQANAILSELNPQFERLATEYLDHGWRIEFWDEPFGTLADKSAMSGTDADLAIVYYNRTGELCLWLIEHKLTESEFTTCGGFRSKGRKTQHDCTRSFIEILGNKALCYYHDIRKFNYWKITKANRDFFVNKAKYIECPFQGGLNQLWRNQLLALAVEQDDRQPYQYAHFSVVKHPRNDALDASLNSFKDLLGYNPRFSVLTSAEILRAVELHADPALEQWLPWYRKLYDL